MSSLAIKSTKKILQNPTFLAVSAIFLLTCLIYFQTWSGLVSIWARSETFAHGFIVIPISLWLVWQKKELHPYLHPSQPSLTGLTFVLLNGFLWLLASLINALVIEQYALIGILVASIWFFLGNETSKKLIFPLAFLYFMVPVGEALLPYLMKFTADFTVYLLRKTGLSVYREGMQFTLVSGQWSVVEACSGLRYLLATITLGTIYAYITYSKTYKRVIFILLSIIVPIIANGFRAYMIVMIGHLSGMKLAVGIDHLIYGAIFFAFIIFIMFYIGAYWRDPDSEIVNEHKTKTSTTSYSTKQNSQLAIILLICLSIWPISSHWLQSHYHAQTDIPQWPPFTQNEDWQEVKAPEWGWRPKFESAVNDELKYYKNKDHIVGLYQANFGDEKQGSELVNSNNVLRRYNADPRLNERRNWHIVKRFSVMLNTPPNNKELAYDSLVLRSNILDEDITILKWYQIGKTHTNNEYVVKLFQLVKRLTLNDDPEVYDIIFFKTNKEVGITQKIITFRIKEETPLT